MIELIFQPFELSTSSDYFTL